MGINILEIDDNKIFYLFSPKYKKVRSLTLGVDFNSNLWENSILLKEKNNKNVRS